MSRYGSGKALINSFALQLAPMPAVVVDERGGRREVTVPIGAEAQLGVIVADGIDLGGERIVIANKDEKEESPESQSPSVNLFGDKLIASLSSIWAEAIDHIGRQQWSWWQTGDSASINRSIEINQVGYWIDTTDTRACSLSCVISTFAGGGEDRKFLRVIPLQLPNAVSNGSSPFLSAVSLEKTVEAMQAANKGVLELLRDQAEAYKSLVIADSEELLADILRQLQGVR